MLQDDFNESNVTVQKDKLIASIERNRIAHEAEYKAAEAGYREAMIAELESALQAARAGERIDVIKVLNLARPKSYIKAYERVLRMLDMSTAETIKISENQFAQYVLDDWEWKANFSSTAESYKRIR